MPNPMYRQMHLILDEDCWVVGVLWGQPREGWWAVHKEAFDALKKAVLHFNQRPAKPNICGDFHSIAHGISFGGKQVVSEPLPFAM